MLRTIQDLASRTGLAYVGDIVKSTDFSTDHIRAELLRLYNEGSVELRPESSVGRPIPAEVRAASPVGPRGEVLSWVRPLQGAKMRPNPPWADKAILDAWPKALRFAKQHGLPMSPSTLTASRKPRFKEYGCGHFGCVFPTDEADVVLKISSDEDEIDFILRASTLDPKHVDLEGLVRYYGVLPIAGQRRGEDLALIWREAAREAGKLDKHAEGNADLAQFAGRLQQAVWFAIGIKDAVKRHRARAAELLEAVEQWMPKAAEALVDRWTPRILDWSKAQPEFWDSSGKLGDAFETAMNIGAYSIVCDAMSKEGPGDLVGETMASLLAHGIVLADVHSGNVGLVKREGRDAWVITDPGVEVLVDPLAPRIIHEAWAATPPGGQALAANTSDQEFLQSAGKYGPASALVIMPPAIPSYLAYRAYLKHRRRRKSKRA